MPFEIAKWEVLYSPSAFVTQPIVTNVPLPADTNTHKCFVRFSETTLFGFVTVVQPNQIIHL